MIIYSFIYSDYQKPEQFNYWFVSTSLLKTFNRKKEDFYHKAVSEGHTQACSTPSFISFLANTKERGNQISLVEAPTKQGKQIFITLAFTLDRSHAKELIANLKEHPPSLSSEIKEIIFVISIPQTYIAKIFSLKAYATKGLITGLIIILGLTGIQFLTRPIINQNLDQQEITPKP